MRKVYSAILVFLLVGCGDFPSPSDFLNFLSSDSDQPALTPPTSTTIPPAILQSLLIDPEKISLPLGLSVELSATGHYSDGSQRVLTNEVEWTIDRTNKVASLVYPGNIVESINVGETTVTASFGKVFTTKQVSVTEAELTQIVSIYPTSATLGDGSLRDFIVTGKFTNNAQKRLDSVECSVSNPLIANATKTGSPNCRVTGKEPGTGTLTVSSGGFNITADLKVEPYKVFSSDLNQNYPHGVWVEDNGDMGVIWQKNWDYFITRYIFGSGWSPPEPVVIPPVIPGFGFAIGTADNGAIMMLNLGEGKIQSLDYSPETGWEVSNLVWLAGGTYDPRLARDLIVRINSTGFGVAAWSYNTEVYTAEFEKGAGWSNPLVRGPGYTPSLSLNDNGEAILAWIYPYEPLELPGFSTYKKNPYAATFSRAKGWSENFHLDQYESTRSIRTLINPSGESFVTWQRYRTLSELWSAQFNADGTLETIELLIPSDTFNYSFGIDPMGNRFFAWREGDSVLVKQKPPGGSWQNSETLFVADRWPQPIYPYQIVEDSFGGLVLAIGDESRLHFYRFTESVGWENITEIPRKLPDNQYTGLFIGAQGRGLVGGYSTFFNLWDPEFGFMSFGSEISGELISIPPPPS